MTLSLIIGKGRVSFGVWGVLCFMEFVCSKILDRIFLFPRRLALSFIVFLV